MHTGKVEGYGRGPEWVDPRTQGQGPNLWEKVPWSRCWTFKRIGSLWKSSAFQEVAALHEFAAGKSISWIRGTWRARLVWLGRTRWISRTRHRLPCLAGAAFPPSLAAFFHVFQQLDPGTLKALGHHQGILVGAWNLGGSDVYRWAMIWKKRLKAGERVKTVGNQNYFRNTLESCPNFSKFQAVGCESTDMTCPSWTHRSRLRSFCGESAPPALEFDCQTATSNWWHPRWFDE